MLAGRFFVLAFLFASPSLAAAADRIEFLSGAKIEGKVVKIRKSEKMIEFESKLGGKTRKSVYPYAKIHAVTLKGKRYLFNKMAAPSRSEAIREAGGGMRRTSAEVRDLIKTVGSTPPDWYDATPLEYPKTLDLSWPQKPPPGWNGQKNIGQYVWEIINPNEGRWKSGVRFMHFLLSKHRDDKTLSRRVMTSLASMYFRFFQDYPRAAFWWQQSKVKPSDSDSIMLAECYWRMGNKQMALAMFHPRKLRVDMIKLLGAMGDTKRAIEIAERYVKAGGQKHNAYMLAGDACRRAGRYDDAIRYYNKVLSAGAARNDDYQKRFNARARENMEAVRVFDRSDVKRVADGVYRASGSGYVGKVQVEVRVADAQIQSVRVTKHSEKQYYSAISDTTGQILAKQSVKGIDATSRATITSEAIINAAAKALAKGAK